MPWGQGHHLIWSHYQCETILVGKPEGRRQLGRTRCRWKDNIKMSFGEICCDFIDWIHLAEDSNQWRAVVNTVINFWFP
jgi:hypothetical protein